MIKYKLVCKNCDLLFDSWFASSKEYEKLKKKNFLSCHNCNSKKVEKDLMAPKILNNYKSKKIEKKTFKEKHIDKKIREYQNFIKNNFDYVGENFAYKARMIHYENKSKRKGIYGTASKDEIEELNNEGIKTEMIPWVEDKKN